MGWTYNTKDSDAPTDGPMITGVAAALTGLSLITVCLRTYVRAILIKAFGIDDWVILVTWIGAAGFAIITIIQTKWGLGLHHISDLPQEDVYNFGLLQYIGAPFYITSILGFKLALLTSYLRFVPKGMYRHTTIAVIVACIMFHLSFLLVQINLCQPVRKQWDPSITNGSCLPSVPFYSAMASITIVFDVTVMLLPFPVLVKSHIQKRKKLVLLGLFGLGIFITIIQIIRIQSVKQLSNYVDSAPLILWSAVENNLGIIVANVPTLAPLVKYYHDRTSRGNTNTRRTGYNYGFGYSGGRSAFTGGGTTRCTTTPSARGVFGSSIRKSKVVGGDDLGSTSTTASSTTAKRTTWGGGPWPDHRSSTLRAKALELGVDLGEGVHDATELRSFEAVVVTNMGGARSTENILPDSERGEGGNGGGGGDEEEGEGEGEPRRPPTGITKKMEVIVTRT